MCILLLEDDGSLQKGISLKLEREGHSVVCADSVSSACAVINAPQFATQPPDLAIIDLNLPDGSGLDICKLLREISPQTYILILTANDAETDIVTGYELGADDYVTKPFSLSVLLSKISAVERRLTPQTEQDAVGKALRLDPLRQTVTIQGEEISLTRNEWRLLHKLSSNAGQIVTKAQLLEALWDIDGDFVDDNTLAVNIRRLREKIETDPSAPSVIENIRGVGYRLRDDWEN